ncbi:MAG: hypothetical protein PHW83_12400, partial [Bacteroidales bacterium]|nr:hypothetical protein [Bacteroidales bacterium]
DQEKGDALMFWSRIGAPLLVVGEGVKVGIGLENPEYELDVAGDLRVKGSIRVCNIVYADELVATNPTWCDYVFNSDYSLMSISELENFIAQNKHLPNIPSATEVENEGLKLKEMNQLMMQKIEELTLYIIELNKRIEELENKN